MKKILAKRIRDLLLAVVFSLCIAGSAFGLDVTIVVDDVTTVTPTPMPDGTTVTMWGYGVNGGAITSPGAPIEVQAGDGILNILLVNNLDVPTSIMIPGLTMDNADRQPVWDDGTTGARGASLTKRVRSLVMETAPNTSATYNFTVTPGTYLYQSGTDPSVQVQMGLYGAVYQDFDAGQAYADTGTVPVTSLQYDDAAVFLLSEIDPTLHAVVTAGTYGTAAYPSTIEYDPKYFLYNGDATSATGTLSGMTAGNDVLVRILNAGLETRTLVLPNLYMNVLAQDGNLQPFVKQKYSVNVQAGKTVDIIVSLPVTFTGNALQLFDSRNMVSLGVGGAAGRTSAIPIPPPAAAVVAGAGGGGGGGCFISTLNFQE